MKKQSILVLSSFVLFMIIGCGDPSLIIQADQECSSDNDCFDALGNTGMCVQGTCQFGSNLPQSEITCGDNEIECADECITCNSPPASYCSNENTFITFVNNGTCDETTGGCMYQQYDQVCTDCYNTCEGICAEVSCPDQNNGCLFLGRCTLQENEPVCEYSQKPDHAICKFNGRKAPEKSTGVCLGGDCVECLEDKDCNDDNDCTTDICDTNTYTCINDYVAGCSPNDDDEWLPNSDIQKCDEPGITSCN